MNKFVRKAGAGRFIPWGVVDSPRLAPKGLSYPSLKNDYLAREEEAKGILFSQLDNPNYPPERRQQLADYINSSYVDPDMFDKNPGAFAMAFDPYNTVVRDGRAIYPHSTDGGRTPDTNPYVTPTNPDIMYLSTKHIGNRAIPDVVAHEFTHTQQLNKGITDYDIEKAFGGRKGWERFVKGLEDPKSNFRRTYLERTLSHAPVIDKAGEDDKYSTYIGRASQGMPEALRVDPREYFADFVAMKRQWEAEGIDITRHPEFVKNVFKGDKAAAKAFYKLMEAYDK